VLVGKPDDVGVWLGQFLPFIPPNIFRVMRAPASHSILTGAYLALGAFFCFALQDASVKWLVAGIAVAQVLFVRSVVISLFLTLRFGPALWGKLWVSPLRYQMLVRGLLLFGAWISYYTASRHLQLAEMTTIYYASPILVTFLSIIFLGEHVPLTRWVVAGIGFLGVIIACLPRDTTQTTAIALAFCAAVLWSISMTLMRSMATKVPSHFQMLAQNSILLVACGSMLPWSWSAVPAHKLLLMITVGALGGIGQYLMVEAAGKAPASVTAPMEYSSLIWAFALGFLIWGDVPAINVFIGGVIIIASGAFLLLSERRSITGG
jgi:drug/metabolite transporter (DMT)-like permease